MLGAAPIAARATQFDRSFMQSRAVDRAFDSRASWIGVPFSRRPAYTRSRHTPGLISVIEPFTPTRAGAL